jgi:hypothetical protein
VLACLLADERVPRRGERDRNVERIYRVGMSALLQVADPQEVAARRELYRRLAAASDALKDVAERVWYSVLKES